MSAPRLASVALLFLTACASWEPATPTYAQPPVEEPTPSHHAPPAAPVNEPEEPPPPPEVAPEKPPVPVGDEVAIASVMLLDDCPEPTADAAAPARRKRPAGASADSVGCEQSTVQFTVHTARPGQFRIERVRVIHPESKRVVGTTTLRKPGYWNDAAGGYGPWDERAISEAPLNVTYQLGTFDLSRAAKPAQVDPHFGPFMLEVLVSIDGRKKTVYSYEFSRHDRSMMVT